MPDGWAEIDLESTERYLQLPGESVLQLEPVDVYVGRVKAHISLSKARAANQVAHVLVWGLVLSLPLNALVIGFGRPEASTEIAGVFTKWYDIVAPLLGAVIGALFGLSIASRSREDS